MTEVITDCGSDGQQPPPLPRRRRPWGLFAVIGILAAVCTVETGYIVTTHWAAARILGETYAGAGANSNSVYGLFRDLKTELDRAYGQPNLSGEDKPKHKQTEPNSEPGATAPPSHGTTTPAWPDPNADLTLDDLLASMKLLQQSYEDAFKWLEDEAIIPQAPPRAKPYTVALTQTDTSYVVRIEPKKDEVKNLTVRMDGQELVIEGQLAKGEAFSDRVPFAEHVKPETLETQLEGAAIIIEIEKS